MATLRLLQRFSALPLEPHLPHLLPLDPVRIAWRASSKLCARQSKFATHDMECNMIARRTSFRVCVPIRSLAATPVKSGCPDAVFP
eukprot:7377701-Prymnesium_polylepis.1